VDNATALFHDKERISKLISYLLVVVGCAELFFFAKITTHEYSRTVKTTKMFCNSDEV